ncbi:MAG: O-Antigen polymerase family [Microgenomates group bacterium Gr01-1014_16]|nr:MAG: O-Antigen polymerase family [Microgenomates group bacterium Gr01-1014_16]
MTKILERFLLLLLLLLLPTQLGYHFWPSWSLVHGIRVDYLSPTIYLTDLIILGLFFLSRFRVSVPLPVLIFATLNILISYSPNIAIYSWLRLLEYFWFFKYLSFRFYWILNIGHWTLSLSIFWTSLLAWMQFLKQASIGGPLYWLGERTFNISTPGIAKISFAGHLLLRPYATLPHPNALAGFLLIAGLIIYYLNSQKKLVIGHWSLVIVALTVPITFSRTAIVLEILVLVSWICSKIKNLKYKIIFFVLCIIPSSLLMIQFSGSPDSLPLRLALNQKALQAIKQNPLLGLGLGNFIPATSSYQLQTTNYQLITQPVHNIYLLAASELGLPATVIIIYLIIKKIKNSLNIEYWILNIAALVVLTTGLADHYWLTLHQNILLLVILISLIKVQFMPTE